MQDAERDLRCFVTARQLHLSAQLRHVFQRNALSYPLFYSCLDPRARQLTVQILLVLQRWLQQGLTDEESANPSSPTAAALAMSRASGVFFLSRHILSYLSFPALATVQPAVSLLVSEFHQLRQEQAQLAAAAASAAAASAAAATAATVASASTAEPVSAPETPPIGPVSTPEQSAPSTPGLGARPSQPESAMATPLRLGRDSATTATTAMTATAAPDTTPNRPTAELPGDASASQLAGARPSAGSAVAAPLGQSMVDALQIRQPLFYCRPPLEAALTADRDSGDALHRPQRTTTYVLFVRMVHHSTLNEETLNPYFGRYGQTGCTVLRRIPLTEAERFVPREMLLALSEAFVRPPSELMVQDFLISTDSPANAQRAVDHANYKELLFAALHDPALNTHALGDVDLVVMRCASLVLRKQSYGPPWDTAALTNEEGGEDGATTGSEANKAATRRHRKRHRRGQLVFSDTQSPSASASAASSASTASEASDAEEADDASSSLDEDDTTADGSGLVFVPDILVDGFPYWTTEDQLTLLFKEYGSVSSIQISSHDLSGAFTGSVLVRMETVEEAVRLSESVHGRNYKGHKLVAGVLNERLELVSLTHAHEVRQTSAVDPDFLVTRNERLWV